MLIRLVKYSILFVVVAGWIVLSIPTLFTLVVGPVVIINGWMGGRSELVLLFFDGFFAAQWLLIKPLLRLDTKVRAANDAARQSSDKLAKASGGA